MSTRFRHAGTGEELEATDAEIARAVKAFSETCGLRWAVDLEEWIVAITSDGHIAKFPEETAERWVPADDGVIVDLVAAFIHASRAQAAKHEAYQTRMLGEARDRAVQRVMGKWAKYRRTR